MENQYLGPLLNSLPVKRININSILPSMQKPLLIHSPSSTAKARILRKNMTPAEKIFWSLVRANRLGVHFRRQVPFGPYIIDFLCYSAKLVIELDGSQHFEKEAQEYDRSRDEFCRANGFTVMRFTNREFLSNTDGVMRYIWEYLKKDRKA